MRVRSVHLLLTRSWKLLLMVLLLTAHMETLQFFTGGRSSLLAIILICMIKSTNIKFLLTNYVLMFYTTGIGKSLPNGLP